MKKSIFLGISAAIVFAAVAILLYPEVFQQKAERKVLYWTDPMIPGYKSDSPGKSPMGMELVAVYDDDSVSVSSQASTEQSAEVEYYTCTMHPSVRESKPGRCPICNMDLTPVYKKGAAPTGKVDLTFSVSAAKQQMIGVKFATVANRTMEKVVHAVGKVDYNERNLALVNLKIGGWIEDLYVDFTGQFVRMGQPLFALYSPELVSAQQEYLLAKKAMPDDRADDLLLQTARQRLRLWGITEAQIADLESRGPERTLAITSPMSGYVIEKMAIKGMNVEPGMNLYKIADISTVWINADVYEYELPYVRVGQKAAVRISSFESENFTGTITYILPYLSQTTRTAQVRIEVSNTAEKLKPGMYADVDIHINLGTRTVIPTNAVLSTGTTNIVFVDKGNGIFELRFVTIGARADDLYEVKEGVSTGERIVSSANFLIDAESKVQGVLQRMEGMSTTQTAHKH